MRVTDEPCVSSPVASGDDRHFHGVFPSLPTACDESGQVDEAGQRSLVRYCIEEGADGLACLLFAGEFYKFSDAERDRVARIVIDEAKHTVPVLVGISHSGTGPSIERGLAAKEAGADGVIVTPPYHANFVTEAALSVRRHYERIAEAVELPVMIQDYETPGGVKLSPAELGSILGGCHNVRYVKVEGGDQVERMRAIRGLVGGRIGIFGGMGGRHLVEELDVGSSGTIPGAEMVGRIVHVYREVAAGNKGRAMGEFQALLPYLDFLTEHFESFVAVEKEILSRKGVIRSPTVRDPHVPLKGTALRELESLLLEMGEI